MIEQVIRMRVGDRLPQFSAQLADEYDRPINLTDRRAWLSVPWVDGDAPYIVECSVVDAVDGVVRYDWSQDEVDAMIPGVYEVTVRVTDLAGDPVLEAPTRRDATLIVTSDIVGFNYLQATDGNLILTTASQPIEV
jgi:hypothetical protein